MVNFIFKEMLTFNDPALLAVYNGFAQMSSHLKKTWEILGKVFEQMTSVDQ